jgi:hypothetical protein
VYVDVRNARTTGTGPTAKAAFSPYQIDPLAGSSVGHSGS